MSVVPVQDFFEIPSHKVTLARHNLWVHLPVQCVHIQSILIECENQELQNVPEQPSKDLWAWKITKRSHSNFTKCWSPECLFTRHKIRENAPTTFLSILQAETCKMRLNFTANSFVFGHINRENLSKTFFGNLGGGELQYAPEFRSKQLRFWTHKSQNST